MKRRGRRRGSSFLLVVVIFCVVSVFASLMVTMLNRSVFQLNTYAVQMRAYYLNHEAQEAVVAALLDNDCEVMKYSSYPRTDSMTHSYELEELGQSTIVLTKEIHPYYGTDRVWAVARIHTTVPDSRPDHDGQEFSFEGTVMVLFDNPVVQLYNISPESL